ncbi:MAG TPA: PHB depolymerase family esterase [Methylomirabilota bacterium]|jgi:poly(hydroxyalkanoate) depolymerase family esterase|nr:PHB depolymerase family esterase [Methylomirabilota bacterium]
MRRAALVLALLALQTPPVHAGAFTSGWHDGRGYALYTPSTPAAGPLVVALHGCWQTPEDFALGTRLNDAAERRGLVVVYPAQGRRDNAYRCWNWFVAAAPPAAGEVGEILALARHVQAERGLRDPHLVVVGFSAGGFMAVNLACAAPQVVSAIGVMAAGAYRCGVGATGGIHCMRGMGADPRVSATACRRAAGMTSLPLRASAWHGAVDPVVSPSNLSALETMLARVLGAVSAVTEPADGAVHALYRDARGHAVLETWLVPGMGHAWSGGDPRGTHTYPAGPRATERMLDFLLAPGR